MLEDLGHYLLEEVLSYLAPPDLSELCKTSRTLYEQTTEYVSHTAISVNRDEQITKFFKKNQDLLLPYEQKLQGHLVSLQEARTTPLYLEVLRQVPDSRDLQRVSIITSYMFSYLGDKDHVFMAPNPVLSREVVYLKEVAWLVFCTNLPRFSAQVYPASYRVRLHLEIRGDVQWKGHTPMVVRILSCLTKEVLRHYFIHPSVWKGVALGQHVDLSYNNYNDKDLKIVPSSTKDWYFLVIDNLVVKDGDELYFNIDDRQNVFWKSGKSWDFIEIMRIN